MIDDTWSSCWCFAVVSSTNYKQNKTSTSSPYEYRWSRQNYKTNITRTKLWISILISYCYGYHKLFIMLAVNKKQGLANFELSPLMIFHMLVCWLLLQLLLYKEPLYTRSHRIYIKKNDNVDRIKFKKNLMNDLMY